MGWDLKNCKGNPQYEQIKRKLAAQAIPACSITNMEPGSCDEPLAKKEVKGFDGQVCIYVHSRRHRLTDSDGACFKYTQDAIVDCGVLRDDSPDIIPESPRKTQETIKGQEYTVIEIFKVDNG